MTRQQWLDTFDREVARSLAAKFDLLVERVIAEGGNENDVRTTAITVRDASYRCRGRLQRWNQG